MRSGASAPDVGFCLPGGMSICSRFTVHTARIGVPSVLNRVYLACTWVTKAGKLSMPPHLNTTNGGIGFLLVTVLSVGTQQRKRFSTASTTSSPLLVVASKNISRVILHGSAPLYSGGPACFAPLTGLRSHLADLLIVTSLGLNWNLMVPC